MVVPRQQIHRARIATAQHSPDELTAGLSYHAPLHYEPLVPKDRRMIITGLGDRMVAPGQAVMLWEHWDRCALRWFPGSHVMHVSRLDYPRRMTSFLHDLMFG